MTVQQFATFDPGIGQIALYHSGNTVSAINIDVISCNNLNVNKTLDELTKISIVIGGVSFTTDILTTSVKTGYYHFTVVPFTVSDVTDINDCVVTALVPGIGQINFSKSNYQALKNNAFRGKTTSFIYDVDRRTTQLKPLNYNAIISGSASPAQYQELNYTSIGITNSRYSGAKTVNTPSISSSYSPYIVPFGIDPAVSGAPFQGASYLLTGSLDSFIFSQSLSDRDIETYLFDGNTKVPISGSSIFTFEGNKILPVKERKIWTKDSLEILYTNKEGKVYTKITG